MTQRTACKRCAIVFFVYKRYNLKLDLPYATEIKRNIYINSSVYEKVLGVLVRN